MFEEVEAFLNDEDVEVRRNAVEMLRGAGTEGTGLLLKAIEDEDWRVRKSAVEVLTSIGNEGVINGLIGVLYLEENAGARNSAIEALVRLSSEATPYLIEAFKTRNRDVRKFIIDILGEIDDKRALKLMLDALKDEDENVRASAVEHLGKMGDPSVVDALIDILNSGDLWVGYPAADALGNISDPRAVDALINALRRRPLREPTLRAIGKIGEPRSLPFIIPYLKDPSKVVQEEALKAINRMFNKGVGEEVIEKAFSNIFGRDALEILLPFTRSDKQGIKAAAILMLGILKDKDAIQSLLEMASEEESRGDVKRALIFIGRDMPESLIEMFKVDDSYQRRILCEIAGEIRDGRFFEPLAHCLKDEDGHVRSLAAVALSRLGDLRAIQYIKPLLLDIYEDVQEAAIDGMGNLKDGLDMEEIIGNLSDRNAILRRNSALLLGILREGSAVSALGFALKDDDVRVRMAVVDALSMIDGDEAVRHLLVGLTDEAPEIRRAAALSLGKIGYRDVVEPLILLLSDRDDWVRAAAAEAIGSIKDERAITPLIGTLKDSCGFVRASAIESLGLIDDDRAKKALLALLGDEDPEIRRTVILSLSTFPDVIDSLAPFIEDKDWAIRKAAVDAIGRIHTDKALGLLKQVIAEEVDPIVKKAAEGYLNV